jgi:hypothetical protein
MPQHPPWFPLFLDLSHRILNYPVMSWAMETLISAWNNPSAVNHSMQQKPARWREGELTQATGHPGKATEGRQTRASCSEERSSAGTAARTATSWAWPERNRLTFCQYRSPPFIHQSRSFFCHPENSGNTVRMKVFLKLLFWLGESECSPRRIEGHEEKGLCWAAWFASIPDELLWLVANE